MKRAIFLIGTILFISGCAGKSEKVCPLKAPSPVALLKYGETLDGAISILNGRLITPAGETLFTGTFPMNLAISPDGKYAAVLNNGAGDIITPGLPDREYESVQIFDLKLKERVKIIPERILGFGVVFSPDGSFLYVTGGGGNFVKKYDVNAGFSPSATWTIAGYPTGIAAGKSGSIYVTLLHEHTLLRINPATGEITGSAHTGPYPYDVVVDEDAGYAYVSNWGADYVSIIDLNSMSEVLTVPAGKNPEGMALSPDGKTLFVACADEDVVAVIQVPEGILLDRVHVTGSPYPGAMPVDVDVTPDGNFALSALAGDNALAVISTDALLVEGYIPTPYWPSGVEISPDGLTIYVTSARGISTYANFENKDVTKDVILGTLSIIPFPDESSLADYTAQVSSNNSATLNFFDVDPACQRLTVPVPPQYGIKSSKIKHVVYIVRENKTYDVYLGDYEKGNGDPELAIFGENGPFGNVTPNTHALARRFAVCDNFYEEAEQSLQGHIWIGLGWINDFMERNWPAMWARSADAMFYIPGAEPAARPGDRILFEHLYKHGISFRIYGDVEGILASFTGKFRKFVNWEFPTWALHVRDVDKADVFIRDLENGIFPEFVYIWLPNDHTHGLTPGTPTPESMIADNDEAVGKVVDAISHSPFWNETVIFIFEDDPQNTPDHVDVHRSPLLIVSPWVKRGYVSSVHYSFPSIHKTMMLILGVEEPLSRFDALAAPILDVFSETPDPEPYTYIERQIPEKICCDSNVPPALISRSLKLDFSGPDRAEGLGEILWEYAKPGVPYPAPVQNDDDE